MPPDIGQAVAELDKWRRERRRDYVCWISVRGLVTARREPEIRNVLGARMAI
jgi:hypothetical protein